MKKIAVLLTFCFLASLVFAQPKNKPDRDKINELKVAFITDKLDLTVEESQKFWPIYNKQQAELRDLRKNLRSADRKPMEDLTDAELEQKIKKRFEIQKKEIDIREKYFEAFKTAIPIRKIARLVMVEKRFKQMLLEKIKGRTR